MAQGPHLLRAQAPPAGLGQTTSQVPTPMLWRGQAGWEGWWEPEPSGMEGTGIQIRSGTLSARQTHLKDVCMHPKGKGPRPSEGVRRQAHRAARTAWEGILDTQGI